MKVADFIPMNQKILVKLETEETTDSGIIVKQNLEAPEVGEVIAISEDLEKTPIKAGDKVYFGKLRKEVVKFEEGNFYIIELRDIKGLIKKKKEQK